MSRDGPRTPIAREDLVGHLQAFTAEHGEPAAFSVHVAHLEGDRLRSVVVFAERHGLEARINPMSWRGPRAICVVFFAPEWVPREVE